MLKKKDIVAILSEVVFRKFEDVVGADIPHAAQANSDTLTVFTYSNFRSNGYRKASFAE